MRDLDPTLVAHDLAQDLELFLALGRGKSARV